MIYKHNIKVFLDIHGAKDTDEFDVDIGTDEKRNLNGKTQILENLIKNLNEKGITKIGIDKKFKACTMHTLTKKIASSTNIACMQIEITRKYLDLESSRKMEKVINAIKSWIQEFG